MGGLRAYWSSDGLLGKQVRRRPRAQRAPFADRPGGLVYTSKLKPGAAGHKEAPRAVRAQNLYLKIKQKSETPLGAGGAPISISPVLSNLQRRYILGRIQSDLRSPSSISNLPTSSS